ncbi:MAG: hypothetical protein AAFP07_20180 [Cyanobacteria bacterium J06606_4]
MSRRTLQYLSWSIEFEGFRLTVSELGRSQFKRRKLESFSLSYFLFGLSVFSAVVVGGASPYRAEASGDGMSEIAVSATAQNPLDLDALESDQPAQPVPLPVPSEPVPFEADPFEPDPSEVAPGMAEEDMPEEILRTEIITEARSPLTGEPLTAAEYAQLQAELADPGGTPLISEDLRYLIFLLQVRRAIRPIVPFF